ncbi:hypothetical protein ACLG6S_13825 [Thermodesulfobacteriota bacterium B35]
MEHPVVLPHADRFLEPARRLVWWMTPEEALANPLRLVLQIMELGTLSELRLLQDEFSDNELKKILQSAPAGILSPRSLRFWQVVLDTDAAPAPRFPRADATGRVWSQG